MRVTRSAIPSAKAFAACALVVLAAAFARAQVGPVHVYKVEPPSWWAGHTVNPVRLLIRGKSLKAAEVSGPTGGQFRLSDVRANESGTYLFADLHIDPAAKPGDYNFRVRGSGTGVAEFTFRLNRPLDPAANFKGITNDDVIYLIMPDRFADGDPKNNAPADSPAEANDRANARAWHGGDLRGIIERLPYLKELGVTAVWTTPWYDNWNGVNRCDKPWCPNTYYHGYHAVDYYAVEDRFGTLETLQELVEKAHALGIKVIQDQVANHVGSQHPWVTQPPLADWFHGTLDKHLRNPFRADMLLSPHAPEAERRKTDRKGVV